MELKKNPFYTLKLSTTAARSEIISKAEEMSFFGDPEECNHAQGVLLNPAKRLTAEIDWFPGLSDSISIDSIIAKIDSDNEISVEGLESIAKLNAVLFNLNNTVIKNPTMMQEEIKQIDGIFSKLSSQEILNVINSDRNVAGIAETREEAVVEALNTKRESIRRLIDEKLEIFQESDYLNIANDIAEKCINNENYKQGVVIDDVINQYELRMQTTIEEKTDEILKAAEEVKKTHNDELRTLKVGTLITKLKQWDRYAQPLQLKARAEGQMHSISENLARDIRNTSIDIHNELNDVDNATKLFQALKDVFAELPEFMAIVTEDAHVLEGNRITKELLEQQAQAYRRSEIGATIIKWVIRIAIFAAIIFLPTMCNHFGNDTSYDSSTDDEYYEEELDENADDNTTEESEKEDVNYVEEEMPESGYVFNNTCDSRPTYVLIENKSDDAYLVHISKTLDEDGEVGGELDGFIAPNSTGQIYVPIGLCRVTYTHGPKWYGEKDKFGDDEEFDGFSIETFDADHYYQITVPIEQTQE